MQLRFRNASGSFYLRHQLFPNEEHPVAVTGCSFLQNQTESEVPADAPAHWPHHRPSDPDLARVIERWPNLPAVIRDVIRRLVD
jgi:hypothetical protein